MGGGGGGGARMCLELGLVLPDVPQWRVYFQAMCATLCLPSTCEKSCLELSSYIWFYIFGKIGNLQWSITYIVDKQSDVRHMSPSINIRLFSRGDKQSP